MKLQDIITERNRIQASTVPMDVKVKNITDLYEAALGKKPHLNTMREIDLLISQGTEKHATRRKLEPLVVEARFKVVFDKISSMLLRLVRESESACTTPNLITSTSESDLTLSAVVPKPEQPLDLPNSTAHIAIGLAGGDTLFVPNNISSQLLPPVEAAADSEQSARLFTDKTYIWERFITPFKPDTDSSENSASYDEELVGSNKPAVTFFSAPSANGAKKRASSQSSNTGGKKRKK